MRAERSNLPVPDCFVVRLRRTPRNDCVRVFSPRLLHISQEAYKVRTSGLAQFIQDCLHLEGGYQFGLVNLQNFSLGRYGVPDENGIRELPVLVEERNYSDSHKLVRRPARKRYRDIFRLEA